MAEMMDCVVHILPNFEVPLSAARELVVKRMSHLSQFFLRNQVVGDASKMLDGAMVEVVPHDLTGAQAHHLLAQAQIVGQMLLHFIPLRISMWTIHRPFRLCMRLGLIHQVRDPCRNRFHHDLRTLPLEKLEHVEVAVALGDLGPELASDLYNRLHLGSIDFDLVHLFRCGVESSEIVLAPQVLMHFPEHVESISQDFVALEFRLCPVGRKLLDLVRLAVPQVFAESIHCLTKNTVRLTLRHLEWTDLVNKVVEYISKMHGVEHSESEIYSEFQARLARCGLDSIAVFE